jgi:transposase
MRAPKALRNPSDDHSDFLGLLPDERVPDHSTLSRTRSRLGAEIYDTMFKFVLEVVAQSGLLKGKVVRMDCVIAGRQP